MVFLILFRAASFFVTVNKILALNTKIECKLKTGILLRDAGLIISIP